MKKINSPQIGSIVLERELMKDVYIVNGKLFSNGRISNWWTYREVLDDGSLGEEKSDYGYFFESNNKYEININCKKLK